MVFLQVLQCCMVYSHFNAQVCCMQDFSKKVQNEHFIAFQVKDKEAEKPHQTSFV